MRRIFRFAVLLAFFAISSSFIIPVKAQQLVFYCEPEDEDGIEELKQMVSEFKKLSKEEIKERDSPVESIDLKKSGDLFAFSMSLSDSFKTINPEITYGFPAKVVKVTIPEGIERLEAGAFYNYSHLTSITIPNSVDFIGERAFEDCENLTSITIPNSVKFIGEDAFKGCDNLKGDVIPESLVQLDGRYVSEAIMKEYMAKAPHLIAYCDLSYVEGEDIEGFVKEFKRVANSSDILKKAKISSISIEREDKNLVVVFSCVPQWNDLFYMRCYVPEENLFVRDVYISKMSESLFEKYEYEQMFRISIVKLTFLEGVEYIHRVPCYNLREVELPNTLITIGEYAFDGLDKLKSITIPNSVKCIDDYAFRYCNSLTSITIPNSVEYIGRQAFSSCDELTNVTIPKSLTEIEDDAFKDSDKVRIIRK